MTRPRRSTRITRLHSYHGAVRPCASHRYSAPHGFRRLRFSLPPTTAGQNCATGRPWARDDRFTRSTPEPGPSSRRLHAGHRLASRQAPARLIPGICLAPGFDVSFPISTRHQRFTHVRLLGPYLTRSDGAPFSATLSTPALDRRTLRWFAASPCRATTKDHQPQGPAPSSLMQHHFQQPGLLHLGSFSVRVHTGRPGSAETGQLNGAASVAVSADGGSVYAANLGSGTVVSAEARCRRWRRGAARWSSCGWP